MALVISFLRWIASPRLATLAASICLTASLCCQAFGNLWVARDGNDATAQRGRSDLPFATIDAAIDASEPGDIVYIGTGLFASPTRFLANPPTFNDLTFQGAGKPGFNRDSTALVGGTRLFGAWHFDAFGETIRNITIRDLGLDNGAQICAQFFGGRAQEGLTTTGNVLDTIIGMRVTNVVSLSKDATVPVHAFSFQCCLDSMFSQLEARYGAHGFAIKSRHCTFTDLIARGHMNDGVILSCSGETLQCAYLSLKGLLVGPMAAGDTGVAVVFASARNGAELRQIVLTNLVATGVRTGVEFRVQPGGTGDAYGLELANLALEGNDTVGSAGIISTVSGSGRVRAQLSNVTVRNFETGFSLGGDFDLINCAAENCQVGVSLFQQNGQTRWRSLTIRNAGAGVNLAIPGVHYLSETPRFVDVETNLIGAGAASGAVVLPQHWRLRSGTSIANTIAERSLLEAPLKEGSRTLSPALLQSQPIRLRAGGTITHAGAPTATFRLKLGAATLATSKMPVATGSQKAWSADLTVQPRAGYEIHSAYPAVSGTVTVNNETIAVAGDWIPVNLSVPTALDFTVQWNVGTAVNSIRTDNATIEVHPSADATPP